MGGKSSAPATPDYTGLAQQQSQESEQLAAQQTTANRPNVSTPWGDLSYSTSAGTDPATGAPVTNWNENVSLTPSEQAAETSQQNIQSNDSSLAQSLQGQISNQIQQPTTQAPTTQSITGAGQGLVTNPNQFDPSAENAVWDQYQTMQLPLQQQQTEQNQSQLEAQGLRPGDAAYDTAMKNLSNTQFGQTQTAEDQAVLAGEQQGSTEFNEANAAQGQGFGQDLSQTTGNNATIGQNITNQASELGLNQSQADYSLNLMNGLLNGQQVSMPTFPGTSSASSGTAADLLGAGQAQGSSLLNAFNAQNATSNANTQAGAGLAAAAIAAFA